jgi:2-polyprenyl-3-methyl-5-hydroxy-6-metoxy-1,4-benzoquinol methylase
VAEQVETRQYDYSKEYFGTMYSGWNRISFNLIASYAREGLACFSPKSILDVGCGNGIYGAVLRENVPFPTELCCCSLQRFGLGLN